jgi:NAD(P)-dependent dehydrogenase (short-subunit alcohol dehydrogenase family)
MTWSDGFRGRVVVVTGASSGIGRATAIAFGRAGARVALLARRRAALEDVAQEVAGGGGAALAVPVDVADAAAVRRAFDVVVERYGGVDDVVNNAGILIPARVEDLRDDDLRAMLDVNLFGLLHVMQAALPVLRARGGGAIVNVASLAGRRGITPLGGYCASKFAVVGLTEALRTEIRGEDIHVALVMPGVIDTPMVARDAELGEVWPSAFNMPASWVVWAIFAALRLRLVEVAVPPGAALLEKVGALAPGLTDAIVTWGAGAARWLASRGRADGPSPG